MTYDKDRLDQENREVLERNLAGSQRITDEKQRASAAAGGPEPHPHDQRNEQEVIPGQADVPVGGTSGSEMNLGGGYKSESRH